MLTFQKESPKGSLFLSIVYCFLSKWSRTDFQLEKFFSSLWNALLRPSSRWQP